MHTPPLQIASIALPDIPEVARLLVLQFGSGFIDAPYLAKFVGQPGYGGWVAKLDGRIVGVALGLVFPIDQIKAHLHLDADQVQALFPVQNQIGMAKSQIGMAKSMATLPTYTGRGIGFALMAERMKWFEQNCEAAISMCWEESNGGAAKLLNRNGFQNLLTLPDYWKEESLRMPYDCARCGSPPCLCTASVFVKYFD